LNQGRLPFACSMFLQMVAPIFSLCPIPSGTSSTVDWLKTHSHPLPIHPVSVSPCEQSNNKRSCYDTVGEEVSQLCKCQGSNSSCVGLSQRVVWQCSCHLQYATHCQNCFTTGAIPRHEKCNDTVGEEACQQTHVSRIKQLIRGTISKYFTPGSIHFQEQGGPGMK